MRWGWHEASLGCESLHLMHGSALDAGEVHACGARGRGAHAWGDAAWRPWAEAGLGPSLPAGCAAGTGAPAEDSP